MLQKLSTILQICTGHKQKWLTQFGAGPAITRSDTMLNTMLKHTHGVWGRWAHTHKRLNTMKDKREAFLFSIIQKMYIYNTMVWLLVSYSKVTWTPLWLFTFHTYPCRIRCSNNSDHHVFFISWSLTVGSWINTFQNSSLGSSYPNHFQTVQMSCNTLRYKNIAVS